MTKVQQPNVVQATSIFNYKYEPSENNCEMRCISLGIKYWVLGRPFNGHSGIKVETLELVGLLVKG